LSPPLIAFAFLRFPCCALPCSCGLVTASSFPPPPPFNTPSHLTPPNPLTPPNRPAHPQDLFYITILAALMGYTHPVPTLARTRPPPRVLSLPLLTSTVLQIAVVVAFQLASLALLRGVGKLPESRGTPDLRQVLSAETSTLYLVGLAQFIILALVFNKGHPHRCGVGAGGLVGGCRFFLRGLAGFAEAWVVCCVRGALKTHGSPHFSSSISALVAN